MRVWITGSEKDIDEATKATVAERYEREDEIKLLRRAIVALSNGEPLPNEFVEYSDFVERVVSERKKLKRVKSDAKR